ncbi:MULTISPECIES: hypothetical protein [unclassified Streptomyces]|uniref:hypothetical protein n=1 Tax=unclassified Streptomyces TaxID=2593676 RepID=UPI0037BDD0C3
MPEDTAPPSPSSALDETMAALAGAHPGLRQSELLEFGAALADVRLTPPGTARFS